MPSEFNDPRTEDLTVPRSKPRLIWVSIAYRLFRAARALLGDSLVGRLLLNGEWLFHRLAFEVSGEIFGEEFYCRSLALSETELRALTPKFGTVIDIGCGYGRWCRVAAKFARRVVGIEMSSSHINRALQMPNGGNIEYLVADAASHRFTEKFDVALLIHVLEHIDDPTVLLESFHHVADTLVVETPDFEADVLNHVRLRLGCPFYCDADHVMEYTEETLRLQMRQAGWEVEKVLRRGGAIAVVCRSAVRSA